MIHPRSMLVFGMILAGVLFRLLPDALGMQRNPAFVWTDAGFLWNLSPLTAMCLFGGARFAQRSWGFVIPLAALLISDVIIGFYRMQPFYYGTMPFVYGAFAVTVCLGFWLRKERSPTNAALAVGSTALLSECIFFLVTNFGVWAVGNSYTHDWAGIVQCYTLAIPFLGKSLLGTALFSTAMFGAFALAEQRFSVLHRPALSTPESC